LPDTEGPLNRQDLITDSGISAGCLDLLPEAAHVVNDHFPSLFRNTANGKLSSLLRNAVNSLISAGNVNSRAL